MAPRTGQSPLEERHPNLHEGVRAFMRITATARLICEANGLTIPQFRIMTLIADEPIRARKLATRLQLTPQALTWAMDQLEELGLIARRRDPDDGRAVQLRVTPKGRRAIKKVDQGLAEFFAKLASPDDVDLLLDALIRTTPVLDGEVRRLSGEPEPDDDPDLVLFPRRMMRPQR